MGDSCSLGLEKNYHLRYSSDMKKPPHHHRVTTTRLRSSSSSSSSSSKLKKRIETFIMSHLCGICRRLRKAKISVIKLVEELSLKRNKKKKSLFLGSFRMHYNWCSSHVVPLHHLEINHNNTFSSSSSSSSTSSKSSNSSIHSICTEEEDNDDARLSGYLHWLELGKGEGMKGKGMTAGNVVVANEIDRLADMFIADSHEKFRLEKVESYRRFQEMLARSV